MKKIILTLALSVAVISGCGAKEEEKLGSAVVETVEKEDKSLRSIEAARNAMEEYLKEKYGVEYTVNLPAPCTEMEEFTFIASAYVKGQSGTELDVAAVAQTGECRDDFCINDVHGYLDTVVSDAAKEIFGESAISTVMCGFGEEVPAKNWPVGSDPEDIIFAEEVSGNVAIAIQMQGGGKPDREKEAEKIQKLLQVIYEKAENFFCEINIYYLEEDVYQWLCDDLTAMEQEGDEPQILRSSACKEFVLKCRLFKNFSSDRYEESLENIREDILKGFKEQE